MVSRSLIARRCDLWLKMGSISLVIIIALGYVEMRTQELPSVLMPGTRRDAAL